MEKKIAEIKFKPAFFSRKRTLVFTDKRIALFKGKRKDIQLKNDEIESSRLGVYWIGKIDFYVGYIFRIELRNKNKKTIKIKLLSPYRINNRVLSKKFSEILNILYKNYFSGKIKTLIRKIEEGEQLEIAGVVFTKEGVFLYPKKDIVLWNDLKTMSDRYYFSLGSKQDREKFRFYKYFKDWNVILVHGVSQGILKNKGLTED